ncbi:tryptophan-rich sensory protein [Phaeobacter sp.]|uniref:tryptophan-rich sensory protein n=1 Tax=Phaeobacter sp. TaxID=1902409 RepID=UPI0025FF331A|nr:tryptophan-rich sensory protein [Phaeobacter sp.]
MSHRIAAYLAFVLAVAFAAAPILTEPFMGYREDQLPFYQSDPVIQPAGWAFGIWGVIYLWLIAGTAYGARAKPDDPDWTAMRRPLVISLGLGVLWLWAANTSPVLATVMIVVMAGTAIAATIRGGKLPQALGLGPVGLYAGWLTAATAVSLSIVVPGYGLLGPMTSGLIALTGALIVALWVLARAPNAISYAVGVCWALFGIVIDQWSSGNWIVLLMAGLGLCLIALRSTLMRVAKE